MDSHIKFLLEIISSVVYNGKEADDPGVDWQSIYDIALKHGIVNIVAYGLKKGKYNVDPSIEAQFTKKMFENVILSENQLHEAKKLLEEFHKQGVSCMPLKGVELKAVYPSGDMRSMSDVDILVKEDEFSRAEKIMNDLGYSFAYESNHEYAYKKPPCMFVELHKSVVPTYNDDLYAYYGNGWRFAQSNGSFVHRMNNEDSFVYLIVHFAKHYRDAGSGIKQVVDIWLYRKKKKPDMDYVYGELEKLGLYKFYKNIEKLSCCWFEGAPYDELTCDMTQFIIGSGEYGNQKNRIAAEEIRANSNISPGQIESRKYIQRIFPGSLFMKEKYPVLNKLPFLLPVFWAVRLVNVVLFKRKSIRKVKQRADFITGENIGGFKKHMQDVGLDIYNGRNRL